MRSITLNRFNSILLCSILIFMVLYYGRVLLIPVCFAALFAMLTRPVATKLERLGMKRVFSSLISLLIVLLLSALIIILVFQQFKSITEDLPKIKERSEQMMHSTEAYFQEKLGLSEEQVKMGRQKVIEGLQSSGSYFMSFFTNFLSFLRDVFLVSAFMFLFLLYREKYEHFFLMLVKEEDREKTRTVLQDISKVAQQYLTGRLISVLIFTVLFTAGFLIVGVKGAFLLAFVAAVLTIVPYVGSILGGIFPFVVALLTSDSSDLAFGALGVILIVQFFDNYFIEPYVIGGAVHLSGFFTILILCVGGLLWGPAGMILFIPMMGVAKIIFDNVVELRPYGYLIGDQEQGNQAERIKEWIKRVFKK
jgi:predicted PurR-regulated permease PerM